MHRIVRYTEGPADPNGSELVKARGHLYYAYNVGKLFLGDTVGSKVWDLVSSLRLSDMQDIEGAVQDKDLLSFNSNLNKFEYITYKEVEPSLELSTITETGVNTYSTSTWNAVVDDAVNLSTGLFLCRAKFAMLGSDRNTFRIRLVADGEEQWQETVNEGKNVYRQDRVIKFPIYLDTERSYTVRLEVFPVKGSVSVGLVDIVFFRIRH